MSDAATIRHSDRDKSVLTGGAHGRGARKKIDGRGRGDILSDMYSAVDVKQQMSRASHWDGGSLSAWAQQIYIIRPMMRHMKDFWHQFLNLEVNGVSLDWGA